MKLSKLFRKFTFWLLIVSVVSIILSLTGADDINLFMIGMNPILFALSSSQYCSTIASVPYLWHALSLITMGLYGLLIDYFIYRKRHSQAVQK